MTDTFKLTGRVLNKAKRPIPNAKVWLTATPADLGDEGDDEVYAACPAITTDNAGYLVLKVAGQPSDERGVDLVVGVQYTVHGDSATTGLEVRTFTAPQAGETLDLADVETEPVDLPPTWSATVARIDAKDATQDDRLDALEAGGGGGGGLDDAGVAALIDDPDSDTATSLSASIADAIAAAGDLSPYTTKRYVDCISNPNTVQGGGNERTARWVRTLSVTTTRWRLRYSRRTATGYLNDATVDSVGMYVGTPAAATSGGGTWSGNFTAVPTQAIGTWSAPTDGSDYVSPWVTDPDLQFQAGVPKLCALGMAFGAGTVGSDQGRGWWLSTTAANAAERDHNYGYVNGAFPGDVRIEVETVTDRSIGFVFGTSLCEGFQAANQGIQIDEVFGNIIASTSGRSAVSTAAIGSSGLGNVATSEWGWTRLRFADSGVSVPDFAILEFSNDVLQIAPGLVPTQNVVRTMVTQLRTLGVKRIYLCTPAPRPAATSAYAGTLQSGVSPGATSVSLSYNPGAQRIALGVGFDYEEVVATAVSGSGPYTVTVPALTKAHAAGTFVRSDVELYRQQVIDWLRGDMPLGVQGILDWDALLAVGAGGWDMDGRYKGVDGIHFRPVTHSLLARLGGG